MHKLQLAGLLAGLAATGCQDDVGGEGAPGPGWYEIDRDAPPPPSSVVFVNAENRVFTTDEPPEELAALEGMLPASEVAPHSDPVANLIFGVDTRTPWRDADDLTTFPKRTIGRLEINGDVTGAEQCTGTLIGARHVLTAAHCVLNPYNQMYAQSTGITFAPGRRGYADYPKDMNGSPHTADGFYAGTNTDGYDYALIILKDEQRTASLGYMGLTWASSDSWYEGRSIALAGYPGGNCAKSPVYPGGPCAEYMYTSQCPIDDAGTDLEFECDAAKGESGGPLYINGSQLLGTLRGSVDDPVNSYNKGVRLTTSKVNTLCSWINNFPSAYAWPHWCSQ